MINYDSQTKMEVHSDFRIFFFVHIVESELFALAITMKTLIVYYF